MSDFKIVSEFKPGGDQPKAIDELVGGIDAGYKYQTLLGVTGSGKTFTIANVIEELQKPTLVIAHNKTLAAQLCSEFREFFPNNAVEYFVSYYDYFQPEAYLPQTDTYIEKDSSINDEIDRLRHSATQAVLERRDVIIVASVSCIYGLGSPAEYKKSNLSIREGVDYNREEILHSLVGMHFTRNDMVLDRSTFRVKGDILEVQPADDEIVIRIEFFGDTVERITTVDHLTGEVLTREDKVVIYPATHFVSSPETMERALKEIEQELAERIDYFNRHNKLIEAQRIEQRTNYDMEMMKEIGYCSGIENYSRILDGRAPGERPYCLMDYFPDDFLVIIDESHQTLPQLRAMYAGDRSRKETLVDFGFRLPSAMDNRPLRFQEFADHINQAVLISATPGPFEHEHSEKIVEQIIRPTGLIDPEVEIRSPQGQIDDLVHEIRQRTSRGERILVTTLTKRMSEDLTEYLMDLGIKVQYLHSEVNTLDRTEILRDLRLGVYDVIIGINLLREGLDLPEVSLVAILDADKEGFLRSETSLIQTIGRAARNIGGKVIMYASDITGSMYRAIDETNRRRKIQSEFNYQHGITPVSIQKSIRDIIESKKVAETKAYYNVGNAVTEDTPLDQIMLVMADLERDMKRSAKDLNFEHAAQLRDEISRLKKMIPTR
ncbi:MAG: excinuclease ABC subunit UvrB [Armatimonadota bacterium]